MLYKKLPVELWINIYSYIDIITLSKMIYVNKYFNNIIISNKWKIVDAIIKSCKVVVIPKKKETLISWKYLVDWDSIILYNLDNKCILQDEVLEWLDDYLILSKISVYQKFSEKIIRIVFDKMSFKNLLQYQILPLDLIYRIVIKSSNISLIDWYNIWSKQDIDDIFVKKYINNINWYCVSLNKNILSYNFINEYSDKLIWQEITKHSLNENIIEKYIHKIDLFCWINILNSKLSSNFIEKYIDTIIKNDHINLLLRFQLLNEKLLDKILNNYDQINNISLYQKLSFNFILKYKEKLILKSLIKNKYILKEYLYKIYN